MQDERSTEDAKHDGDLPDCDQSGVDEDDALGPVEAGRAGLLDEPGVEAVGPLESASRAAASVGEVKKADSRDRDDSRAEPERAREDDRPLTPGRESSASSGARAEESFWTVLRYSISENLPAARLVFIVVATAIAVFLLAGASVLLVRFISDTFLVLKVASATASVAVTISVLLYRRARGIRKSREDDGGTTDSSSGGDAR